LFLFFSEPNNPTLAFTHLTSLPSLPPSLPSSDSLGFHKVGSPDPTLGAVTLHCCTPPPKSARVSLPHSHPFSLPPSLPPSPPSDSLGFHKTGNPDPTGCGHPPLLHPSPQVCPCLSPIFSPRPPSLPPSLPQTLSASTRWATRTLLSARSLCIVTSLPPSLRVSGSLPALQPLMP